MKFFVVVFLCLAIPNVLGMSEETKELAASLHKTCVGETGVDEALIDKLNQEKVMPNDEKLKCYMMCLMSQTAAVSDDGVVDVEAVVALMPDEVKADVEPVLRSCGSKVGSSPCDSVWLTHVCYLETKPEIYMLI